MKRMQFSLSQLLKQKLTQPQCNEICVRSDRLGSKSIRTNYRQMMMMWLHFRTRIPINKVSSIYIQQRKIQCLFFTSQNLKTKNKTYTKRINKLDAFILKQSTH